MGQESASYWLALSPDAEGDFVAALSRAGAELLCRHDARLDLCLRDPLRYWIDVRLHRVPEPRLEIRIALTNDPWSIRAPLQRALTPLPAALEGESLRDDHGDELAVAGQERWLYALESDYDRRREAFVARFGDFTAPLCAEQVYTFIHRSRKRRDIADAADAQRRLELEMLEGLWQESPPPGHEDEPRR